jgi:hypothetical protein
VSFRLISKQSPRLSPTRWRGSPSPPRLRWPLRCPPPGTPRLHPPDQAVRGDYRLELPQGVQGCGWHAWQPQMPWQTAGNRRDSHASCRLPRRSSCFQAGLVLRPVSSPLQQKQPRICPRTIFLLPPREVFACPWGGALWRPPTPLVRGQTSTATAPCTLAPLYTVYSPCV